MGITKDMSLGSHLVFTHSVSSDDETFSPGDGFPFDGYPTYKSIDTIVVVDILISICKISYIVFGYDYVLYEKFFEINIYVHIFQIFHRLEKSY
ncbi:hypothetical protein [Desulfocicer niacini]